MVYKRVLTFGLVVSGVYAIYKIGFCDSNSMFWNPPREEYWQSVTDGRVEPKTRLAELPKFRPNPSKDGQHMINQDMLIKLCKQFAFKLHVLIPQMRQDYDANDVDNKFNFIIKLSGVFAEFKLTFIKHMLSRQLRVFCDTNDLYDFKIYEMTEDRDNDICTLYVDFYPIFIFNECDYAGKYLIELYYDQV